MRATIVLIAAVMMLAGGCGRKVSTVENPIAITADEYDRVFEAAVDTLRDMRFIVDRKDRRFGVVTTQPLIASAVVEPWHADNTTGRQVWESTLNMQRRTVRVEIEPAVDEAAETADAAQAPAEAAPEPAPAAAEAGAAGYRLRVLVAVDRRHLPNRPLHTAALPRVGAEYADRRYRPLETEAGVEEPSWQPIGRDEHLERRLVEAILTRANAPKA